MSAGSSQDLLTRTCSSWCKDLWQDFIRIFTTSSHKGLCKTLVKSFMHYEPLRLHHETLTCQINIEGPSRELIKNSLPGILENLLNRHRATTRAIRHAQSAENVARAKFAPRHNESDLTRTKCREGCASDIQIRTAPQRERSDANKVPRRLRKRYQNSHRATTRAIRHAQSHFRGLREHVLDVLQIIALTWRNER